MRCKIYFIVSIFLFGYINVAFTEVSSEDINLNNIIDKLEKRYSQTGFSAVFTQISTLKAIEVTDTASGTMIVKRPGMMRWEYIEPEKQTIISDGDMLWVYRPEDNQVIVGKAPDFFKDGKGAGFLSNMEILKKKFSITIENKNDNDVYVLKLLPNEDVMDISYIYLNISKKTFNIKEIKSYNSYGDETKIILRDIEFKNNIDNSIFYFNIPYGVDVLEFDDS